MTRRTGVGQEASDLAVLDPPGRPRGLPRHVRQCSLRLKKARLVKDEDGFRVVQVLYHLGMQVVSLRLGIPTDHA